MKNGLESLAYRRGAGCDGEAGFRQFAFRSTPRYVLQFIKNQRDQITARGIQYVLAGHGCRDDEDGDTPVLVITEEECVSEPIDDLRVPDDLVPTRAINRDNNRWPECGDNCYELRHRLQVREAGGYGYFIRCWAIYREPRQRDRFQMWLSALVGCGRRVRMGWGSGH